MIFYFLQCVAIKDIVQFTGLTRYQKHKDVKILNVTLYYTVGYSYRLILNVTLYYTVGYSYRLILNVTLYCIVRYSYRCHINRIDYKYDRHPVYE